MASNTEEDHLNDPCDKRDEEGKPAGECHKDGSRTMVGSTAEAEENGEASEAST